MYSIIYEKDVDKMWPSCGRCSLKVGSTEINYRKIGQARYKLYSKRYLHFLDYFCLLDTYCQVKFGLDEKVPGTDFCTFTLA
jgi:hypothetical protein